MPVRYTHHANQKFKDLDRLGVHVTKRRVSSILKKPNFIDAETDYPNFIAAGPLDATHLLRIVYRKEDDILVVITFYPTRKERYTYEKKI